MFVAGVRPRSGVDFADRKATIRGRFDLMLLSINEGTDRNAGFGESRHDCSQAVLLACHIEAALGRDLVAALRDQHGRVRLDVQGDLHHLVRCGHLEVERHSHSLSESMDVVVLNVSAILAEVACDSACPAAFRFDCGSDWVRLVGLSRFANGRDVINVDTEDGHESGIVPPRPNHTGAGRSILRAAYGRCMDDFHKSLESVLNDLLSQGRRVTDVCLAAVESYFENDTDVSAGVIREDATIDHVDVQIERSCIALMGYRPSDEHDQRSILTIVKINNELERIADCAVNIAQATEQRKDTEVADTLRVMANSVVGMVRDTVEALRSRDTNLAQRVLSFDDTVDAFKDELVTRAQNALAGGVVSVGAAMQLLAVVRAVERMADHCTNICEQVIYLETGKIVRHLPSGWTAPTLPEDA